MKAVATLFLAFAIRVIAQFDVNSLLEEPKYQPFIQVIIDKAPVCLTDPAISAGKLSLDDCPGLNSLLDQIDQGVANPTISCEVSCSAAFAQLQPDCFSAFKKAFTSSSDFKDLDGQFFAACDEAIASGAAATTPSRNPLSSRVVRLAPGVAPIAVPVVAVVSAVAPIAVPVLAPVVPVVTAEEPILAPEVTVVTAEEPILAPEVTVVTVATVPPPPRKNLSPPTSSTNIGAIIGGVVGGIAVLAAIAALVLWRKRRSSTTTQSSTKASAMSTAPPPFLQPEALQRGPTRPEDSAALAQSMSSLPSLSASADPVLQWVASSVAGTALTTRKSSQRSMPKNMSSLEFTWPEVRVLKPLGLGSFGKVYLGILNHTPVAFKLLIDARAAAAATNASALPSGTINGDGFEGAPAVASHDALVSEASILASVRHPNVALLVGYCLNPPCLALEYASRGSLFDVLKTAAADPTAAAELTWRRRLGMAADAAAGMLHLHTRSPPILHRDLKSPNLLVTAEWTVKVTDMGLSKVASEASRNASATNGPGNNPRWLAPEVLDGARATEASDVFSFGVVMWELLTWRLPWDDVNVWTIVGGVMRGARPEVPALNLLPGERLTNGAAVEAYMALMKRCWAQAPEDRPYFEVVASELRAFVL